MAEDPLLEIADGLYAQPADAFTAARDAAARTCEDKALAARVEKLRKPSVAAWAGRSSPGSVKVIISALTTSSPPVTNGIAMIAAWVPMPSATPAAPAPRV